MTSILEVEQLDTLSSNASSTLTIGGTNTTTIAFGPNVTTTPSSLAMTPAFEACLSNDQTVSHATLTKVQFDQERFDTDNCYDNSTNYRFTPTVAGKYHIYSTVQFKTSGYDMYAGQMYVRKNGSNYLSDRITPNNSSILEAPVTVSTTIDMNGSTDYIEIFGYIERHGGSDDQRFESGLKNSFFGAYKLIGV